MGAKILVIDDNALVRKMLLQYLVRKDYEVSECSSGFGVMNMVKEFRPDIVLLDMNMPGLSGQNVAKMIKKHITYSSVKVISFSGMEASEQQALVSEGLVDGYFVKSNTFDGLTGLLETTVGYGDVGR